MPSHRSLVFALSLALAGSALADEPNPAPLEISRTGYAGSQAFVIEGGGLAASELLGESVSDSRGEAFGRVQEILIDESGRIEAVVVSFGGFLGVGEKLVAVVWDQVKPAPGGKGLLVRLPREQIAEAPPFKRREGDGAD